MMNMNPNPPDRELTFCGGMYPGPANSLRVALLQFVNSGAKRVTVYFASEGGSTSEGIALYSFLRSLPLELTFHANGGVGSMAIPVFLAADKRLASEHSYFFFHEYTWTHAQATVVTQTTIDEHRLLLDQAMTWTKRVVTERTKLTPKQFEQDKMFDSPVIFDAARALKAGIVSAIEEPKMTVANVPLVVT